MLIPMYNLEFVLNYYHNCCIENYTTINWSNQQKYNNVTDLFKKNIFASCTVSI